LLLEEPAVPGNIEVFKRLEQHIGIPLAAGERDRTIWEFVPYPHERCLDVLQPECCHSGGITQMKKIATLAEAYHVPLAPPRTASYVGSAASLHVVASIPFFLIHESYPDNEGFNPKSFLNMAWQLDRHGYISLPPGPGRGVEVNKKLLEEAAKEPQSYHRPSVKLRDGSIADY
jgi:galactonate dehydratase